MVNSRRKGASAEREFAALLHEELGVKLERNLEQSRGGGHDLLPPPGVEGSAADVLRMLAIECKRYRQATPAMVAKWWNQATRQALSVNAWPVLAYRADRQRWRVVLPLAAITTTPAAWSGAEWTIETTIEAFCALVRESLILDPGDQFQKVLPGGKPARVIRARSSLSTAPKN
jgi:Holliday junction resolvase